MGVGASPSFARQYRGQERTVMSSVSRRNFVAGLGLAGASLGLAARRAMAHEHGAGGLDYGLSATYDACLKACTHCAQTCESTLQHCLQMGPPHLMGNHVQVLIQCAKLCQLSASLITAQSNLAVKQCGVCAEACDACAAACGQAPADDIMKA